MYFSNITNEELQHFHGIVGADFSMSLTDILTSNLFKVETVIVDKIYRVYPLFYCREVISSNVNDKLLDTKCLILQKSNHESYLSFITNSSRDNIILNEDILNIKDIGDILTTNDFNAFVYRLRQIGSLKGNLNFEDETTIAGVYATYEFNNIDGQLRNDSGIIVNDKVKNNPLTVKLTNPFFLNAKYTLNFTVFSISGANVCEESKGDFITKDSFSVDLVEDSDVAIPLGDYVNDSILDFDVTVSISFDVPEIVNSNFILLLNVDKNSINIGDEINLTANLNGEDNIANYTIQFFEDNVLIGSQSTNNEGIASLTFTPSVVGNHIYSAKVLGLASEVNVVVNKLNTSLSVNVNKDSIVYGDEITLSGTLLIDDEAVNGLTVKLYNNNILIDTLTTDNLGNISVTLNNLDPGNNNLKLVYEETNVHKTCNASVSVIVKIPTYIMIQRYTSPPIYAVETSYETEGILYNSIDNTPIANKTVTVRENGSNNLTSLTTDENGVFYTRRILASGNRSLIFNFNGDTYYDASTITHSFTVIKHTSEFRDVSIKANTISGYLIQSETNKPIKRARVEVLFDTNYVHGCTTDNEGYFVNSQRNAGQDYSPRIWNSLNYAGDYYNSALELDLTEFAVLRTTKILDISQNDPNGEYFNHVGKLVDDLGNPIPNATINITQTVNNYKFSRITDENGLFTVNSTIVTSLECEYMGDNGIEGCTGNVV